MPSKHGVGGSIPSVGAIFLFKFKVKIIRNMKNKYYSEIKNKIENSLENKDFDFAFNLIKEELSMPYIPLEFEKYLTESIEKIPLNEKESSLLFSIEKIIDLLIKVDNDKNDYSKLINQLEKFNLKTNIDEIEYFFSKAKNKRNIALVFDELCKQKINIDLIFGNPSKIKPIKEMKDYINDSIKIEDLLSKYPLLIEPGKELLSEIYLTKHMGQKLPGEFYDVVIYTLSKIFFQPELIDQISDIEKIQNKLEMFKSITNL